MPLDPIGALFAAGTKSATDVAKPAVGALSRRAYDKLKVQLTECFSSHLLFAEDRCRNIKNIMYRDEAANIDTQYVQVSFKSIKSNISDDNVIEQVKKGKRYIISGRAGFGKTIFMKWATLQLITSKPNHQRYPLFLELRYMDEQQAKDGLLRYIYLKTSIDKGISTQEQFIMGLNEGMFIFVLDAVDEISFKYRDAVVAEIQDILRRFPKCPALISSRPDDTLQSIGELSVIHTLPMDKQQVIKVIENLEYNDETKRSLIDDLNNGLFEQQKDFLSNPLLATIMLLTYDQSVELPKKITAFYKQAFEALYKRHDASKGAFRRDHHAALPMEDFEYIFSVFCYQTYISHQYEFSDVSLSRAMKAAVEFSGINTDYNKVIRDSIHSASILQKEGLDNTFVHRSFQEYFAALFIANYRGPDVADLMTVAAFNSSDSGMFKMLLELKPDLIEFDWLLPKIEQWLGVVEHQNMRDAHGMECFMRATFSGFDYPVFGGVVHSHSLGDGTAAQWMSPVCGLYENKKLTNEIFHKHVPSLKELMSQLRVRNINRPAKIVRAESAFGAGNE